MKAKRQTEETVTETPQPLRLDLGCGQRKAEGFTGVDIAPCEGVDIVADLNAPHWDFAADDSVDEIVCSHFIEHVDKIEAFMDECWRILKPGGRMTVIAPYYNSVRCWQDPTHKHAISELSFLYYNREWREQNGLSHYNIKCDFDFTYGYAFMPEWAARSAEAQAFAVKHYTNVVSDIQVTLTKRAA